MRPDQHAKDSLLCLLCQLGQRSKQERSASRPAISRETSRRRRCRRTVQVRPLNLQSWQAVVDPLPPLDVAESSRMRGPRCHRLRSQGADVRGHRGSVRHGRSGACHNTVARQDVRGGTASQPFRPLTAFARAFSTRGLSPEAPTRRCVSSLNCCSWGGDSDAKRCRRRGLPCAARQ